MMLRLKFIAFSFLCFQFFGSVTCFACLLQWVSETPAPNTDGQVEGIANFEVSGAINAVTPHPENADVLFAGAVSGGVWRTLNATAGKPTWESLTDKMDSLSISALEFDLSDSNLNTLVAGTGQTSSFGGEGVLAGVYKTTDAGATWDQIDGKLFIGSQEVGKVSDLDITGISVFKDELVVAARLKSRTTSAGIWRSTDNGVKWSREISGRCFDLTRDPSNPMVLYTNGLDATGSPGIFRSNDHGSSWNKVSTFQMDSLLGAANNVQIAVGHNGATLVVIASSSISGVFHRLDDNSQWSSLSLPLSEIGGIHPGNQADTHLSVAVDPNDGNIVYIGGDRQDGSFPPRGLVNPPPQNSIGATDYVGALARGDARKIPPTQWLSLIHI